MNVLGYDPHITVDAAWSLPSQVKKAHSVEEVLKASDFVTLHVPLLDVTRKMINAERVKLMKNGAILLNFSREASWTTTAVLEGARVQAHPLLRVRFPGAGSCRAIRRSWRCRTSAPRRARRRTTAR